MPHESFWSEIVHLAFSGRLRQKIGENWRKTAKIMLFCAAIFSMVLQPRDFIPIPLESFRSKVVHLTFLGRSHQKFGENWRKTAKIMLFCAAIFS